MKPSLPILLTVAMLAVAMTLAHSASRSLAESAEPVSGEVLIQQVAEKMARQGAFRAELLQHVDLFGQRLTGTGSYLQKPSTRGLLVRLDWEVQIGERTASLQHVSNGRFLWMRRDLLDGPVLERVDLDRVRAAISPLQEDNPTVAFTTDLVSLGLSNLLQKIAQSYRFTSPRAALLGDLPVWVVEGQWQPPSDVESADSHTGKPSTEEAKLMPHLPTHVRVVVCRQGLSLRRIEYVRIDGREGSARASGDADGQPRTLTMIELIGISESVTLDDQLFTLNTGNEEFVDYTERFLRR